MGKILDLRKSLSAEHFTSARAQLAEVLQGLSAAMEQDRRGVMEAENVHELADMIAETALTLAVASEQFIALSAVSRKTLKR